MPTCSGSTPNFCSYLTAFGALVNPLIALLAGIALVVFFIGLVRFIYNAGDAKEHETGKRLIGWGIVALVVLFAFAGIINFFASDIFGTSALQGGTVPSASAQ